MSKPPSSATASSTDRATCSGSALSAWIATAVPPISAICATSFSASAAEAPYVKATAAPSAASLRTISAPMPRDPPVTSARRPVSDVVMPPSRRIAPRTFPVCRPTVTAAPMVKAVKLGDKKRVVVWGTGFVGRMVIAEIVKHPLFELVGVGVSNPEKVGRDVGEICALGQKLGLADTDDVDALIALKPDALVHYGPTAAHADDNIALITRFLRAGIDVCSTAMTPWVWPTMHLNPPNWIEPITEACELGESSCFTTGIDPGFANDLFPMTLMGLCSEVHKVRASELLDYTNYEGDYEFEMGIGKPPDYRPLLENKDILVFAWGATVPMIAHAAGIMLDE